MNKKAVIFGGTGFIGTFFAKQLIECEGYDQIYLCDYKTKGNKNYIDSYIFKNEKIKIINIDIREKINLELDTNIDLICNFAAIHREPGHEYHEYFQTNLKGAENVCNWADKIGCKNIIFTSSVAPYGGTELEKTENTMPMPDTAYGISKLVAEKIHQIWQKDDDNKKLITIRPGVVFGPGEDGNVPRLIKAIKNNYFFYTGNKDTVKAGVYIKELCLALAWSINFQSASDKNYILFNMSMYPMPTIEEYANTIQLVLNKKSLIINIPFNLLLISSYIINPLINFFQPEHPFKPTRIKKLIKSNNIKPDFLLKNGYKFKYSLDTAMRDWKKDAPSDWQ